jgi:hypothetical protein
MTEFDWSAVSSRRRSWAPNDPKPTSEKTLAPKTISRGLALTDLEISVKDFIQDGISRQDAQVLTPQIQAVLLRNVEDEDKHLIALTRAKKALTDYDNSFESEALQIIAAWNECEDHPITKAAVLELGCFFPLLGMYNMFGSVSLGISSRSISSDEMIHSTTHRVAAQLVGARPSKSLNKLRLATVAWLGENLEEETPTMTKDRLLQNSNRLIKTGKSDLVETSSYSVLAPYEINNRSFESYD